MTSAPAARRARAPRRASLLAPLAAVALLTGCGAGLDATTYQDRDLPDGTDAAVGGIALRNAQVETPRRDSYEVGDDAVFQVFVSNNLAEADTLVDVESDAAQSAALVDEDGDQIDEVELDGLASQNVFVRLQNLRERAFPGQYIPVTLRFENNGEIVVNAPIASPREYDDTRERDPNFHPIGEAEH